MNSTAPMMGDHRARSLISERPVPAIRRRDRAEQSFTLLEMVVSMALLIILGYILVMISTFVASTNSRVSGGVNSFQDASIAFDTITKTLAQATLNTYTDYYPSQVGGVVFNNQVNGVGGTLSSLPPPAVYIRQSELHFVCGPAASLVATTATPSINPTHAVFFQAPLGYSTNAAYAATPVRDLLNVCGFFLAFGSNTSWIPSFLPARSNAYRYRLMEVLQPTENFGLYTDTALASTNSGSVLPSVYDSGAASYQWITSATGSSFARPIADNIIALIIQPMLDSQDQASYGASFPSTTFATTYQYDSRIDSINTSSVPAQQLEQNQLPPLMQVTMVAIDEPSALRLEAQNSNACPNLVANAGSNLFTLNANYTADMLKLTTYLTGLHVKYRVFTAQVPMFNAKWTTK